MNFELKDSAKQIQETMREFAQNELQPGAIERDETREFPKELIRRMGEVGFTGIVHDKKVGGLGLGYEEYATAIREVAKVDASAAITSMVCSSLYGNTLAYADVSDAFREKYLKPVVTGEKIGCFGLTEPTAGSDVAGALTFAVKDGNEYVINGSKCFITNGPLSDYIALYAYTDKELGPQKSMGCFLVPTNTPGLTIGSRHNTSGVRSAHICEFFFNDMRIPVDNVIAEPGTGFKLAMKVLDGGRIGVAAQGLGVAEGAFEIARNFMKEREQFGKPIYKHQYLSFNMAQLSVEIDAARDLIYHAAWAKDNNVAGFGLMAAKAKLYATDTAMHVTTQAVQMMGGNGYMKEYEVERMMRDAKITQIYEGTNEIQKLIIGGSLFR